MLSSQWDTSWYVLHGVWEASGKWLLLRPHLYAPTFIATAAFLLWCLDTFDHIWGVLGTRTANQTIFKRSSLKQTLIILTDSLSQEFWQSIAEITCPCFIMSGAWARRLKDWGPESSGSLCIHVSGGWCWLSAEILAGSLYDLRSLQVIVWASLQAGGWVARAGILKAQGKNMWHF